MSQIRNNSICLYIMEKHEIINRIGELESRMMQPDFWDDSVTAQQVIKDIQELRDQLDGIGKYDKGNAIVSIMSGAGGDDAEDFSRILLSVYQKYAENKGWNIAILDENQNPSGGYRHVTFEIDGKNAYGNLKYENGVHRLVRLSPFNSHNKRQTSFSMVETIPVLDNITDIELAPEDLDIDFSRAGGPGGQNVNKRETAVRILHKPSGLSVRSTSERTQEANKNKALQILAGKIAHQMNEQRLSEEDEFKISNTTKNEWGSQIRSYILHPYKMVKDHRTDVQVNNIDDVFDRGNIQAFIDAMKEKELSSGSGACK